MGRGPAKAKKDAGSSKRGAASAAAAGKQTRKPRKKKDPNAPKRALTPFMFFGKECREILKVEMPHLGFLEVSSEIGRRWAQVSDQDKKKYEKMAQSDKDRYQDEKDQYTPDPEYENAGKTKGARGKNKDPNAPKRPLSAYFFFCQEVRPTIREKNPTKSITEIAPLLAEQWRLLPEKKRTKYHKLASDAKANYQTALATYKNGGVAVADEDDEVEDVEEEVQEEDDEEEEEEEEDDE
ncbi:hypothetical protein H310_09199 [Aphanomyces invadans]|uniref:HMG box domain-containing protein n=1 Tax=Aphanomyces invadans TaxID=157072 RepID=A0A024TV73_9STRA|nr:hypothetical protein H310_09199 [Aphanomyces invadans]ETV97874.1 hypothetical protein H310_09199 [Aphanomyces invadans]RHY35325.1 hypothetical protein DYB32_000178 [Aphanomyces invadans]|eukprot:XP_008873435.1 hypothetical protein H310_09199 [Aphanomyces invadans]